MHKLKLKLLIVSLTSLFFSFSIPNSAKASDTSNFYFKDFTADYYLERDANGGSHLRVVEELIAVFPNSLDQNHGITRSIPFTNQDGKNLTMASDKHLEIKAYRNNQPETISKIERGYDSFLVYIGDKNSYQHGEQVYRLEYQFQDVMINDIDNGNQVLYWDANGTGWMQPFGRVTARLHVDPTIQNRLAHKNYCYIGQYGERGEGRCTITEDGNLIEFSSENLNGYENLTFAVEFEPDTFAPIPTKYNWFILIPIGFGSIYIILAVILLIRIHLNTAKQRHYWNGLFLKPEYTPPANLTVAEIATNYNRKSRLGDSKVATLLELAVNHKIQLIKSEDSHKKFQKASWTIRVLSLDLSATQNDVLRMLAGDIMALQVGQEIQVKSHTATRGLISLAKAFEPKLQDSLIEKRLLKPSAKTKVHQYGSGFDLSLKTPVTRLNVISLAYFVIFLPILLFLFDYIFVPYLESPFGDLTYFIIYAIWLIPPIAACLIASKYQKFYTHTESGLAYIKYLDGLKLYIKMAEQDRINFLQSVTGTEVNQQGILKLYEKLLPYAILFKLEKSWLKTLEQYYKIMPDSNPNWYIGAGAFTAHSFSQSLFSFNRAASSDISHSTTSSSSSSSFSSSSSGGGGFSGGGGGGGGGGGW